MSNQPLSSPLSSPLPRTQVYAVVEGDLVVNIIAADQSFVAGKHDHIRVDGVTPRPGPGWKRTGAGWSAPAPPPAPPIAPQLVSPAPDGNAH